MSKKTTIKAQKRRSLRVRRRIKQESDRVRVSVFKSTSHIYAQVIDDAAQNTLASCSTLELKDLQGDKKEVARLVGIELAKRAQKAGVVKAVFDRGQFLYHGRVKSLAEGLREGGLEI